MAMMAIGDLPTDLNEGRTVATKRYGLHGAIALTRLANIGSRGRGLLQSSRIDFALSREGARNSRHFSADEARAGDGGLSSRP